MKTKERILQASLLLFNEEGETHVTTVDVANSLDISPGNLYYHFKGKEVIILALFQRHEASFSELLQAPLSQQLKIEDAWYYLYLIFEEIYQYRFLYQDISQLLLHYPPLNKRFRSLIQQQFRTANSLIRQLCKVDIIDIDPLAQGTLVHSVVMTVTFWLTFDQLKGGNQGAQQIIHQGVFQILSLLMPYLSPQATELRERCIQYYQQQLTGK